MISADGVKDLINIVEGTGVSDLPAVLLILGLITEAVCGTPSRAAQESREFKEAQGPEEMWFLMLLYLSGSHCGSWLTNGAGRCNQETPLLPVASFFMYDVIKVHYTS